MGESIGFNLLVSALYTAIILLLLSILGFLISNYPTFIFLIFTIGALFAAVHISLISIKGFRPTNPESMIKCKPQRTE